MATESVTESQKSKRSACRKHGTNAHSAPIPVITMSADMPPDHVFLGVTDEPYAVMFRHRNGGFQPIVLASFEVALEQPIDVLAPGKDEQGQLDRLEHIRWHKWRRDENARMEDRLARLPPGFEFHGVRTNPAEAVFMRESLGAEPEFLFVSFEQALGQPAEALAGESRMQQEIRETILAHQARRDRRAQL